MVFRVFKILLLVMAAALIVPAAIVLLYREVPPPVTPLMLMRGGAIHYDWVPMTRIAPALARAVLTAEDENFCRHNGFDTAAIQKALDQYLDDEEDRTLRGGSTISQQTAKNVLLWPDRTWLRKGLETALTVMIEALWPKRRIMEVYLNIVEWAPAVYGAEAAARHHFQKNASQLSAHEAAALAAVLPNPRKWNASNPGPYVRQRTDTLQGRAARVGELAACLKLK
ncbi:MAG: monofunctional biosynthetic peptidoglycan transglycosylase [Rhodospirillaceae bacterium]|nr:monofunctional biosynthetic peptidoglycan transglycosylase [Rhodospirillaceae bacterium]